MIYLHCHYNDYSVMFEETVAWHVLLQGLKGLLLTILKKKKTKKTLFNKLLELVECDKVVDIDCKENFKLSLAP